MSRCIVCLKWTVFLFNLVFWLCGLGILGVAIFLRVDPSTQPFFDGHGSIHRYHIATYILMAVGTLMAIIGFLGCCGALRESRCMLGTFFALLVIVFVAEIAGGIVAYVHRDQLTRTFIENGFTEIVKTEYGKQGFEQRTEYLNVVQSELECCGAKSVWDWYQSDWHGGNGDIGSNGTQEYLVPFSCCKKQFRDVDPRCRSSDQNPRGGITQNLIKTNADIINERGCGAKLMDIVEANRDVIIGVGVGIAVIQVFGLIFSIILCCAIKPHTYGYKT